MYQGANLSLRHGKDGLIDWEATRTLWAERLVERAGERLETIAPRVWGYSEPGARVTREPADLNSRVGVGDHPGRNVLAPSSSSRRPNARGLLCGPVLMGVRFAWSKRSCNARSLPERRRSVHALSHICLGYCKLTATCVNQCDRT